MPSIKIVGADGSVIFSQHLCFVGDEENAAHIVECVNAMEGIGKPPAVKELIEAVKGHIDYWGDDYHFDNLRKALEGLEIE